MATVSIQLPHHQYEIIIEPHALDRLGEIVRDVVPHNICAMLADENVFKLYGKQAKAALNAAGYSVVIGRQPAGENHKTLDTVRELYDVLLEAKLERRSPVVSLGGGVTGDTVGFVAATYLRGVPFIQCPTSLLSMVDASVGGKVGVNVPQGKNLVGAFYQPHAVVIDPLVLSTLPVRGLRCGLAECVKHGMIHDRELFDWTEEKLPELQRLDPDILVELLVRNVKSKARVVEEDEKEQGVRAQLNFGHTFGHAVEQTSGYGVIEHGEAVALGMIAAAKLAENRGICGSEVSERLAHLTRKIGLPVRAKLEPVGQLIEAMKLDKKVSGGRMRLILPRAIGEVIVVDDVREEEVAAAWEAVRG